MNGKTPTMPRLTALFARVGNLTFGGGDPTMAALYTELVTARRWLSNETYGLIYALARITPGTNILAFCAAAGWEMLGLAGSVIAVLSVTLPSAVLVVLMSAGYESWKTNPWAMAGIGGILAAASGMMAAGAWQLMAPQWKTGRWARAIVIVAGSFLLVQRLAVAPIAALALAALAGAFWRVPETE
jgi:chromate transporter